jgi:hypothetical protein
MVIRVEGRVRCGNAAARRELHAIFPGVDTHNEEDLRCHADVCVAYSDVRGNAYDSLSGVVSQLAVCGMTRRKAIFPRDLKTDDWLYRLSTPWNGSTGTVR